MAALMTKLLFRLPEWVLYRMSGKPPIQLGERKLNAAFQLLCVQAGEEPLGNTGSDPVQVRQAMAQAPDLGINPPSKVERLNHEISVDSAGNKDTKTAAKAQIRIREYRPAGWSEGDANMLYIHGGGWVLCDLESHDLVCANIAARTGCRVFAVEYRLAPEYPFPTPLQDCLAAWHWMLAQMGCKAENTAVGGDSAGGNLSAALCLSLQADDKTLPCLQFLIYPAVDGALKSKSSKELGKGFYLTANAMKWFLDCYQPDAKKRTNPLLAPAKAKSLQGMPQAVIVTAGFDPLRDEGQAFLKKLQKDGVDCWYKEYPDLTHGFANLMAIPAAAKAMAECSDEVRRRLQAI